MRLSLWALAPAIAGCALVAVTSCSTDETETEAGLAPSVSASVATVSAYDIAQVSSIDVDGNLSEWANIDSISMADTTTRGGGQDNTAKVKLAWDNTYLYLAYRVTDTELLADKTARDDPDIFKDDEVELFVDPQGDGGADLKMNATDYHFLANIRDAVGDKRGEDPPPPQGQDPNYNANSFLSKTVLSGTLNGPGADVSYTVEQRISWVDLGVTPAVGHFMRIDLAIGDKDAPGTLEQFDWAGIALYNNPSGWKDVQLVSGDVTPPVISKVVSAPASDRAAVMWKTDELSNSSVDYGPTASYGSTTPVQAGPDTAHTVLVTGLAAQQVYHYRVRSVDPAGNPTVSGDGTFSTSPAGTLAAFPGAQGGGASTPGGRGGRVIPVTSLSDAGGGSLRACVEASGPRTCVFRVAGTIVLNTALAVNNLKGTLTIAGQTAPGGGILLRCKELTAAEACLRVRTNDVVIRYLRSRVGHGLFGSDALAVQNRSRNVVVDHVSLSWANDENLSVWNGVNSPTGDVQRDITFSWMLLAESLPDGAEGSTSSRAFLTGASGIDANSTDSHTFASLMTNIDMHHSMLSNHTHRAPLYKTKSARLVNNIIYNNDWHSTQLKGGINADIIGNVYKQGTLTHNPANPHEINAFDVTGNNGGAVSGAPSIYLLGNKGWNQPSPGGNQWALAAETSGENQGEIGVIPPAWQRGSALAHSSVPIVAQSADNIESMLTGSNGAGASSRLDCNGNWVANRDAVDTRLMSQYASGTGSRPMGPSYEEGAGFGWPTIASGTACTDADNDGMADIWEAANGLLTNVDDGNALAANGSGYTNLDMYLAGMPAR